MKVLLKNNMFYFIILNIFCINNVIFLGDNSNFYKINLQEPVTPIAFGIMKLHDHILFFLVLILFIVVYLLFSTYASFDYYKIDKYTEDYEQRKAERFAASWFLTAMVTFKEKIQERIEDKYSNIAHGTTIEMVWTILPALILILIAIPSFVLLYAMDELIDPVLTVKIIGHQWYWSYEFSDYSDNTLETKVKFDSYMVNDDELKRGDLRLLKTDKPLFLPKNTHIRLIITSSDVLHSWAVPSFGIKTDAVPGRLNQTSVYIKNSGIFYGQCSELCGVNHAFMPIEVYVVDPIFFYNYIFLKYFDKI